MRRKWLVIPLFFTLGVAQAQAAISERTIQEIIDILVSQYVHPVDREALINAGKGGIEALIKFLNDPLVRYFPETQNYLFNSKENPKTMGLLVNVTSKQFPTLDMPGMFTSAWRADIRKGDVLLKVDEQPLNVLTADEQSKLVIDLGDSAIVTLRRGDQEFTLPLTRESPTYARLETDGLPSGVAYLALTSLFNQQGLPEYVQAFGTLQKKRSKTLILDLRNNSGGLLSQMVDVFDRLSSAGDITLTNRDGKKDVYGRARRQNTDFKGRIIVLVNQHTRSGAEILAAALREQGALIVGERTLGDRYASLAIDVRSGRLQLPTQIIGTTNGPFPETGLTPDVLLTDDRPRLPPGQYVDLQRDAILRKALEFVSQP